MVRFTLGSRVASVVAVSVTLAVWLAGASTALASPAWTITLNGTSQGTLNRVSCTATGACIAVGSDVNSSGTTQTLAEQSSGTPSQWEVMNTPSVPGASSASLSDVSCTAANACIAVGYYVTNSGAQQMLAERWTGTGTGGWSILPAPPSGGKLARISCSAANACTALGQSGGTTLVYRWNGIAWSSQTFAIPAHARSAALNGVSCASARTDCIAVGEWFGTVCNNNQPTCNCLRFPYCTSGNWRLAEQWNGNTNTWTVQTSPGQGILSDVSCTSTGCVAVGAIISTLIAEQWVNGGAWEETLPLSNRLGTAMSGVSCTSVYYCVAVGYITNSSGAQTTLAEQSAWMIQPTPSVPGAVNSYLTGVSCTAFAACTAVGYYTNSAGNDLTLAEQYF
jgi:hypothetical protein